MSRRGDSLPIIESLVRKKQSNRDFDTESCLNSSAMITFMDSKEKMKEPDKCLDSQLWHACAGGMVQMPAVNSRVFYFVQGHAEHACGNIDFRNFPRIPPYILCRVSSVKFMADTETDEVYAKIRLIPVDKNELNYEDDSNLGINVSDSPEKPASFAKTLTQSDANNGGGFSVPRYCAETIFPRLDYSADPPVQNILAKDVHGETWKFRHIYRGTPRRHLLTTGWSTFVNHKKLVAGDSIVFLRAENGDLCVGIRRVKRGIGAGHESWNPAGGNYTLPYGGFSAFLRDDDGKLSRNVNSVSSSSNGGCSWGKVKVTAEAVYEAATLAANGQPFEVVYYPRASTPEFCVKASIVKAALQNRWCSGMRFKMPFETEDSSRISWFMGTISSVQVADPIRWPDSPWRLLLVTWDEPDLLQNVKRVSPWLVELVSNMPAIHLSPFSPPRKKLRLPHQHPDFALDGQIPIPPFPSNLFSCLQENTPAGMQGARQAHHYPFPLSDLQHLSKLQSAVYLDHTPKTPPKPSNKLNPAKTEDDSCLLTIGNSTDPIKKSADLNLNVITPQFVLFGQPILTEQQISRSCSGDTVSPVGTGNSSSEGNPEKLTDQSSSEGLHWYNKRECELNLGTGHCKVFMESEDVGRTLDLSELCSYEELYKRMANMFGIERAEMPGHVLYRDTNGAIKQLGNESFSDFVRTARRLTILMESSSDNVEI